MSSLTRRSILVAAPAVLLAQRAFARPENPDFAAIERASGGKLGLFAIDTGTGATLAWRGEDRFPFCSSFKAPLAGFILWKADRGQLRLDHPVLYGEADLLPYAPVTRAHLGEGSLTFEALCAATVEVSDNSAANLLLRETGGPEALTAWMRQQGDPAFDLSSTEPKLNWSRFGGRLDTTTPQAMAESYRRLVLGDVLSPASRDKLAGWLVACTTGGRRLRAGLPPSWRVGDKTGTYEGDWCSTVDIGIAWPTGRAPLVIAGLLTDTKGTASAERALAEAARQVTAWAARASTSPP